MNIQGEIDKILSKYPVVNDYLEWVKYVPQGSQLPDGSTHRLMLVNITGDEVVVAIRAKPLYGALADALLKVL